MLGKRDPAVYGRLSIVELEGKIYEWGRELELTVQCRQTNSEGEFIKWCHDAYANTDGMVVNPGAWTHYAWSIHDERDEWRRTSVLKDIVAARFVGEGPDGYRQALQYLKEHA